MCLVVVVYCGKTPKLPSSNEHLFRLVSVFVFVTGFVFWLVYRVIGPIILIDDEKKLINI